MAYDSVRGKVVLFGGASANYFGDTWEWDGNSWSQRSNDGPAPRYLHAMAYDSARGRVVLFGGSYYDNGDHNFGDTWEWDGASWTQVSTTGPTPRFGHAMAFDPIIRRTVLFGGYSPLLGDTWEWNGYDWVRTATSGPAPRLYTAATFDSVRGHVVLFGGWIGVRNLGDMWEYHRRLPVTRSPEAQ